MSLAESSRERRDIVTGDVMPEARLVRFVVGPDGTVTPDVGRKLPGRGLWVEARREAVELAARKGGFSRAAKAKTVAPADLADKVDALLKSRVLNGLGLARRAGDLTFGFEKAASAIEQGKVAWMVEASDGAADGRRKLLQSARRAAALNLASPRLFGAFTGEELSLALGLGNVIHVAFLAGRGAERWTVDVERLSGFRPLLPVSWREEPSGGRND
jgi:predicted RNA-binding protein YlxR (DUF448 family)